MVNLLVAMVDYNVPVILLLAAFVIGFASKVAACYAYDAALENVMGEPDGLKGLGADIVRNYVEKTSHGAVIRNTKAFVDNRINAWKRFGISVVKVEEIGNMCGYICIVAGAFFDMALLTEKVEIGDRLNVSMCVYVYTALAVILFAVLQLWGSVVASGHKREWLSDAMTDYLDNGLTMEQKIAMKENTVSEENAAKERNATKERNAVKERNTAKERNAAKERNETKDENAAMEENAAVEENAVLEENIGVEENAALKANMAHKEKAQKKAAIHIAAEKKSLEGTLQTKTATEDIGVSEEKNENDHEPDHRQTRENVIAQVLNEYL